jgi:uncharacterized protein YcgI (DUF1989 family)
VADSRDHRLEPGTAAAIELRRGEVLRIGQVEGGQCADFNAFNLHDYKEHFHAGRTRAIHGLHPGEGSILWSAPPRERAMLTLIRDTAESNDLNYPRCTGLLYEYTWGLIDHPNCQDLLAEAEGQYGLTPDDVHDSFNLWMNTGVNPDGTLFVGANTSQAGDHVEMLAQMDLLAVVAICSADLFNTSNFALKHLDLSVREASEDEKADDLLSDGSRLRNQRGLADFRVREIKATRELYRDPDYEPNWAAHKLRPTDIELELSGEQEEMLDALLAGGQAGSSDAEAIRHAFFSWCFEAEATPDKMRDMTT